MAMSLTPHLNFNGNAREAFDFYAKCLNGKVDFSMTWGESPMSKTMDASQQDRIVHIHLIADGFTLMGADAPSQHYQAPTGATTLNLTVNTPEEVDRLLEALGEGGKVVMPPQKTFWSERFGMVTDRYGHAWMAGVAGTGA